MTRLMRRILWTAVVVGELALIVGRDFFRPGMHWLLLAGAVAASGAILAAMRWLRGWAMRLAILGVACASWIGLWAAIIVGATRAPDLAAVALTSAPPLIAASVFAAYWRIGRGKAA